LHVNGGIVDDLSHIASGLGLKRREWVILNRFHTSQGIDEATVTRRFVIVAQQTPSYVLDSPLMSF
jgi:hypothetical protein